MGIFGIAKKGFGLLGKRKPSKSKWVKGGSEKRGSIIGVKPGSGNIPWHVGSGGKNLKRRAEIVKTDRRVKTIDAIASAQKKIKSGKKEIKKLRETGWVGKPIGRGRDRHYFPKREGTASHMVVKKKPKYKKSAPPNEDVPF